VIGGTVDFIVARSTSKSAQRKTAGPIYGGNSKHQEPWQRGRKGSVCNKETTAQAQALLDASAIDGKQRFATDGERAYKGAEHAPSLWHGWPVGWKEVPDALRHRWLREGRVKRGSLAHYWHDHVGRR
jgi:hypothetical protein